MRRNLSHCCATPWIDWNGLHAEGLAAWDSQAFTELQAWVRESDFLYWHWFLWRSSASWCGWDGLYTQGYIPRDNQAIRKAGKSHTLFDRPREDAFDVHPTIPKSCEPHIRFDRSSKSSKAFQIKMSRNRCWSRPWLPTLTADCTRCCAKFIMDCNKVKCEFPCGPKESALRSFRDWNANFWGTARSAVRSFQWLSVNHCESFQGLTLQCRIFCELWEDAA